MSAAQPAETRRELSEWLNRQDVRFDQIDRNTAFGELIAGPNPDHGSACHTASHSRDSALRVLMPICQKIGSTGSGVVVRELVNRAAEKGIKFLVICGSEPGDQPANLFQHWSTEVKPVYFRSVAPTALPFAIVGMSERMPYESVRFRDLTVAELTAYLDVWREHIRSAIKTFRPHVLHVHHLWLLAAVCAAAAPKVPLVVSLHGTDLQQAGRCAHLRSLVAPWTGCFAHFLALSDESVMEATDFYAPRADKISILGNGFNESLFRPMPTPSTIIDRYRLTNFANRKIVLFVGKYVEWKGIEWLLRAFATLLRDDRKDLALVIGGTGPESERLRYQRLIRDFGMQHCVLLTGEIRYEDVGALMNFATVFVLPSFHEPFGLVLLEALACGSRIVASDQGGPAQFVPLTLRDSRDAILVSGLPDVVPSASDAAKFIKDLAKSIDEQLAKPLLFEKRRAISESVHHLTWDSYVAVLQGIYHQLVFGEAAKNG